MATRTTKPVKPRASHLKNCALLTFRTVRKVQAKAGQLPCALLRARDEVVAAWKESGGTLPNV